jgi:hypothetical protein
LFSGVYAAQVEELNRDFSRQFGGRSPLPHLRSLAIAVALAIALLAGSWLAYDRVGAETLRQSLYRPLSVALKEAEDAVQAASLDLAIGGRLSTTLDTFGKEQRIPARLRRRVAALSPRTASFFVAVQDVRESAVRAVSARILELRSARGDSEWRERSTASLREQQRGKGMPDSIIALPAVNHEYRGRTFDSHLQLAGPGGPVFVVRDWLEFPRSIEVVEGLWTELDLLYFNDRLESWFYEITREDLRKRGFSLVQFLAPIHEELRTSRPFEHLVRERPVLLSEIHALRELALDRARNPRRPSDLLDR